MRKATGSSTEEYFPIDFKISTVELTLLDLDLKRKTKK